MSRHEIRLASENTRSSPQLPGFWTFWWMSWMQPILLHQRLLECDIDVPGESVLQLWWVDDSRRTVRRQYIRHSATMLVIGTPVIGFAVAGILDGCGLSMDYGHVAIGVAVCVAIGVAVCVAVYVAGALAFYV